MQSVQNKVHRHDSYITVTFNNYIYIYILGHKKFAYKPIYQSMVLLYIWSTIYNKDSRESLKITKSTVGHDTVPCNSETVPFNSFH